MMYYLIYQITNLLNGMIYVGYHQTENKYDNYMGSGPALREDIKKYGIENFKKEILFIFDNEKEMIMKEIEIVDESFINRLDTYNSRLGGTGGWGIKKGKILVVDKFGNNFIVSSKDERIKARELTPYVGIIGTVVAKDITGKGYIVQQDDDRLKTKELVGVAKGTVVVKDKAGNNFRVSIDDERIKTRELVDINTGTVVMQDKSGKNFRVKVDDERIKTGEIISCIANTAVVKDKDGNMFRVDINDPKLKNGELTGVTKGKVVVKDKDGNCLCIDKTDELYLSGELVSINKGRKATEETKETLRKSSIGKNLGKRFPNGKHSTKSKDTISKKNGYPIIILDSNNIMIMTFCSVNKAHKFLKIQNSTLTGTYLDKNILFYKNSKIIDLPGDGFYIKSGERLKPFLVDQLVKLNKNQLNRHYIFFFSQSLFKISLPMFNI